MYNLRPIGTPSMTNKRTAYSHRMELTPQSTNTPIRLPQDTPLLWRGWGRPSYRPITCPPQGTPLLWRGRGRSPHHPSTCPPQGTPL
ncbi:hypothetical protein, partial [Hoylesella oralis]|uniref:hypothetical protein n=1 Tax=Hoylesella oralis TaxID=28134 RepID=UPI001C9C40D1